MKNGTVEDVIENVIENTPEKDVNTLGIIERRLTALLEQRQRIALQLQQLAAEDVGCQGAIATLEAIRAEMVTTKAEEERDEETS